MATDFLDTSQLTGVVNNASSAAYTAIWAVFGLILFAIILYFIIDFLQYKHVIVLKVLTKNSFYVDTIKAKEVDKKGYIFWKTRHYGMASVPPPDAVHMSKKGKRVAEGYYDAESGIVWATDKVTRADFEKKISEWRTTPDGKKEQVFREVFQPITTQQRALYVSEIEKANLRGNKKLLELIFQYAPLFIVFMIFALVVIFYEDITRPSIQMAQTTAQISKENAIISQQNAQLLNILLGNRQNITQTINAIPPDAIVNGGAVGGVNG